MQIANIFGSEPLIIPVTVDCLRLCNQQELRLRLAHIADTLDTQQIAQHTTTRTRLKVSLNA